MKDAAWTSAPKPTQSQPRIKYSTNRIKPFVTLPLIHSSLGWQRAATTHPGVKPNSLAAHGHRPVILPVARTMVKDGLASPHTTYRPSFIKTFLTIYLIGLRAVFCFVSSVRAEPAPQKPTPIRESSSKSATTSPSLSFSYMLDCQMIQAESNYLDSLLF